MKTSKKKKIIIGLLVALAVIAIILVLLNEWGNREHEKMLEATKLEQELEEKALKEQQEQEEKERQERLAKLEEGWNALGEKQEYLALGSEHLTRTITNQGGLEYHSFEYDINFIDAFFMINDGWFQGCSNEDLGKILRVALYELPDNATGRQVYDALCNYIENNNNRSEVVTGQGADVLEGLVKNDSSPTSNNQSSNSSGNNPTSSSNNSNSKYVSEQRGYKVGDKAQTTADGVYTYLGKDIWQSSSGKTYKARLVGSNIEFFAKSSFGVSSATDEDGYLLSNDDVVVSGGQNEPTFPDEDSNDPSGYRQGTAQWHAYWDGTTIKEYFERGGSGYFTTTYNSTFYNYPDNYVIGSYAVIKENFFEDGSDWVGKY